VAAEGGLLTFGVRPTRPETGFGYLELGGEQGRVGEWRVHRLARFVEKPDHDTARHYLEDGGYLWNSGIFVWSVAELMEEITRQLPQLADGLERIAAALGGERERPVIEQVYPTLQRISVDYGIMEGARRCWTVPVKFPWSDVGAWPAVGELLDGDRDGNAARGRTLARDCSGCVLIGEDTVVAAAGVDNLIVVATPDAVLVVPASEAQRVKQLVEEIEQRGWNDVL
jgi:mannose-1-phosphate guanylyltransferase